MVIVRPVRSSWVEATERGIMDASLTYMAKTDRETCHWSKQTVSAVNCERKTNCAMLIIHQTKLKHSWMKTKPPEYTMGPFKSLLLRVFDLKLKHVICVWLMKKLKPLSCTWRQFVGPGRLILCWFPLKYLMKNKNNLWNNLNSKIRTTVAAWFIRQIISHFCDLCILI